MIGKGLVRGLAADVRGSALAPSALLRVAQMQEADRSTIAAGTPGVVLMQNAGTAVVRAIVQRWRVCRVSVLCGPGNNGGDGFVVAGELAAAGWPVRLAMLGSREHLAGDARHHAARWGGPIEALAPAAVNNAELVVDALFGSGLNRPLDDTAERTLRAAVQRRVPLVAIDIPSGVLGDTGESQGAVGTQCTVTFARKKPGHVLMPGRALCGDVVVADIGTPAAVLETIAVNTWENDPELWQDQLPLPHAAGNKYQRGHALVCGGYPTTGRGARGSRPHQHCSAPGRAADLRKRADQHHGQAALATRGFCGPAQRRPV